MGAHIFTLHAGLEDGTPHIRWAVVATFVASETSEPRCIDYRVRVVPRGADPVETYRNYLRVNAAMHDQTTTRDEAEALGTFPSGGIPRVVFESASQARLLAQARWDLAHDSEEVRRQFQWAPLFDDDTSAALSRVPVQRGGKISRGRPWSRPLDERLAILRDVERIYDSGQGTRASVAKAHNMSESSLRDLLHWARNVAEPPLFTSPGQGVRGGRLTQAARDMIEGD